MKGREPSDPTPLLRGRRLWRLTGRQRLLTQAAAAAIFLVAARPDTTGARDLKALADIVVPAYTAMNFTILCAQDDPHFAAQTRGPRGTAIQYAEHVKNEAIVSLTHAEASVVLKAAADEARSVARREVRKVVTKPPEFQPGELTKWCRESVIHFVRAFIEQHDAQHAALIQNIEQAKQ